MASTLNMPHLSANPVAFSGGGGGLRLGSSRQGGVSRSIETSSGLADVWREIQGCNNWEDLVEPLDSLLRNEIIRYGEFVTACYKAFDLDPNSKRYLNCKYGKQNLLREVGMEKSGYEVTKYIYATPDINIPIQMGLVVAAGSDTLLCHRTKKLRD
ncbi:Phospholipase A1-Ialpha2, chloroplastic [Vitis vinifera]|uniref:Phospholipase A1-Ialpha2, chloroplastic n=1 Tax=Vitis vinifera TaxID=29760 RepID=A0A438FTC0_VITVI|nr:Phospholipase A1-Ialpha2, chloroplastic [Vitis vinifera]